MSTLLDPFMHLLSAHLLFQPPSAPFPTKYTPIEYSNTPSYGDIRPCMLEYKYSSSAGREVSHVR